MRLRFSLLAEWDLHEIFEYTRKRWSDEQALKYAIEMDDTFRLLLRHTDSGRALPEPYDSFRALRHRAHVAYYVYADDELTIVRVLHKNMLPLRYLREALDEAEKR